MNRAFLLFSVLAFLSLSARAATVIDVSHEWNAHLSTSSVTHQRVRTPEDMAALAVKLSTDSACACDVLKPQEYLEESTYAFTGFVDDATGEKKGKRIITFDTDEIFKGTPKQEMKVNVEIKKDGCDLPFEKGQTYLVFAKWEWGTVSTHRCMGTKLLEKTRADALGPSERMKEKLYIDLRNACMGRRDTACCLQSLKAMKAGYYIPEPEAGCPDGAQPDRLKCSGSYTWCIPTTEKRVQP